MPEGRQSKARQGEARQGKARKEGEIVSLKDERVRAP